MRTRFVMVLGTLAVSLLSNRAQAESPYDVCRAALARDAYSLDFSSYSEAHYRRSIKSLLCDSSNRSKQVALQAKISAIIPGYEVPVAGSYGNSSNESEAHAHCEQKLDAVSLDQIDNVLEKVVDNSAALAAFNQCIIDVRGGFFASLLQPGHRVAPGEGFTVVTSWRPSGPGNPITLGDMIPSDNVTCDPRSQIKAGVKLLVNGTLKARCKRLDCGPVSISLTDSDQIDAPELYMAGVCPPQCDGKNVDLDTDSNNCGACNNRCMGACEGGTCRSYKVSSGVTHSQQMPDKAAKFFLGNLPPLGHDARIRLQGSLTLNFMCKTWDWSNSPYRLDVSILANGQNIAEETFVKANGPKRGSDLVTLDVDQEINVKGGDVVTFTATALPTENWCYRSGQFGHPADESNVQSFSVEIVTAHNPKTP